jgi:hypothetical protein
LRETSFPTSPKSRATSGAIGAIPKNRLCRTLDDRPFPRARRNADQLNAQLDYTNRFLRISQLSLAHDTGRVEVPLAGINLPPTSISMTNASSTIDPEPVRRALGKVAPPFMREVHFDSPPLVKASGSFIPGDDSGTDMHFFVQGDHFHWNGLIRRFRPGRGGLPRPHGGCDQCPGQPLQDRQAERLDHHRMGAGAAPASAARHVSRTLTSALWPRN